MRRGRTTRTFVHVDCYHTATRGICVRSTTGRSFLGDTSGHASRTALGITITALLATAGAVKADVIADFNEIGARTAAPTGIPAPYPAVTDEEKRTVSWVDLATMHLAMYDAVVAIEGKYQPYAVTPLSPAAGASSTAAAGAAACAVLQGLFPNRSPQYAADCAHLSAWRRRRRRREQGHCARRRGRADDARRTRWRRSRYAGELRRRVAVLATSSRRPPATRYCTSDRTCVLSQWRRCSSSGPMGRRT